MELQFGNCFYDRNGACVACVPHFRKFVRDGEVCFAQTERVPEFTEIAHKLSEACPGIWGCICFQGFKQKDGSVRVFEINARFGGGYPICDAAGGTFARWLLMDAMGKTPDYHDDWKEGSGCYDMMRRCLRMTINDSVRIVLDIDDTLYLERDYVRSGFRAVGEWLLAECRRHGFFELAWNHFLSGRRGDIFNQVLHDINLSGDGLVDRMVAVYRTHTPDIHLLPDAQSFLQNHAATELAIISDGHSVSQWAKVRALGLEERVGTIIITNDWGREFWKPHTRAFEAVQQGYSPGQCVYIAGNPLKDFIAPAALGWMPSIRVRRAESLHEDVPTPGDCFEVRTLDEISTL